MDEIQQLREAKAFAERWANKGYEKGEGQKFWIDLLQNVLGMNDAVQKCKFEMLVSNGGFIDFLPTTPSILPWKKPTALTSLAMKRRLWGTFSALREPN